MEWYPKLRNLYKPCLVDYTTRLVGSTEWGFLIWRSIMNDIIVYKEDSTFQEDIALIKDATTKVFLISGKILQNIQDNKKYKQAGYKTFTEAIYAELQMKKSQAYRLIDAAIAYENLSPIGEFLLPTTESQIRPIAKLSKDEQIEVWKEVAKNKVPTAKEVQEAVNKKLNKVSGTKKSSTIDTTKYITIEEYNKALARIKELETILEMQSKVIDECMIQEQKTMDIVPAPEVEKGAIKRAKAFTFVKKFGSDLQVLAITNQNPDNKRLYNLFDKVRLDYLQHSPPTSLESDILDATHII